VFYRIVVPPGFSSCAEQTWALARRLAAAFDAELVLAHCLVEAPLFGVGPFTMNRSREFYRAVRKWAEEHLEE
jgi:hypothetical protein